MKNIALVFFAITAFISCKSVNLPENISRTESLKIQAKYLNKLWPEVKADLAKNNIKVSGGFYSQHFPTFHLLVQKNVAVFAGTSFDLFYQIKVDKRTKEIVSAKPDYVIAASAVLKFDINKTLVVIQSKGLFHRGSVIDQVLNSQVLKEKSQGYKTIHSISIGYDLMRHHRETVFPYGYHLHISFRDPVKNKYSIYLTVLSNQDLPKDGDGNEVRHGQGWFSTGLKPIQFWGSNGGK